MFNALNRLNIAERLLCCRIGFAIFHISLKHGCYPALKKFSLWNSCGGDYMVTVCYDCRHWADFGKHICVLWRKLRKLSDSRIFFKNNLAVRCGINFERISLTNTKRPPDFFRYNHSSEIVDSSDDSCCFHIKNSLRTILPFVWYIFSKLFAVILFDSYSFLYRNFLWWHIFTTYKKYNFITI